MGIRKGYIPTAEAELATWAGNFVSGITAGAEELEIPQAEAAALQGAYSTFMGLYMEASGPVRNPAVTTAKNEAKEALVGQIRAMVGFRLKNPKIPKAKLRELGLPVPDGVRTPKPRPTTYPTFTIIQKGAGMLGIIYQEGAGRKGSRPPEANGARIYYGVPDAPPASQEELPASVFATRCPHTITFRETDRGKRAYFALQWENAKGEEGPWSEIQSEIIP